MQVPWRDEATPIRGDDLCLGPRVSTGRIADTHPSGERDLDADFFAILRPVEGWLSHNEAKLLFQLARDLRGNGAIVEIGSWKGKSTICLARGSLQGPRSDVFAIDPHTGSPEQHEEFGEQIFTFPEFQRNLAKAGVHDLVKPILKTSDEACKEWGRPIELLFIDASHEEESVNHDFQVWWPHVVEGGWIVLHDTTASVRAGLCGWRGPRRVANRHLYASTQVGRLMLVDTISAGQKTPLHTPEQAEIKRRLRAKKLPGDVLGEAISWGTHLPTPAKRFIRRLFVRQD